MSFNPHPLRGAGATYYAANSVCNLPVSILTRSEERVQQGSVRFCNRCYKCFNPHPLRRFRRGQGGCFNPHPLRGAGATLSPRTGAHIMNSFNPHPRSEEHTSELQSQSNLVCRLLLEKN